MAEIFVRLPSYYFDVNTASLTSVYEYTLDSSLDAVDMCSLSPFESFAEALCNLIPKLALCPLDLDFHSDHHLLDTAQRKPQH